MRPWATRTSGTIHFLLAALVTGLVAGAPPASGEVINEDLKLLASDGAAGEEFGYSVAIDNSVVAVGARFGDDSGIDSGVAYLLDASTGGEIVKLIPTDGAAGDEFGFSIAISHGIVAVGARRDDDNGASAGAAYLFDQSTGAQIAKLLPSDGAAGDEFGHAIGIDGGIVAIGAKRDDDNGSDSGSAYLFDASTGAQIAKLLADDGAVNDNFGGSIAIDDGVVAVGAHADWDNGPLSGSAYLFDASTGDQLAKLLADNGATNDFFGSAIDIDNGLVAVGAWAKSIFFDHSGAAYVFDVSTGSQIAYIVPSDGHDRDHFGISISIDNGVVAIGAHQDGDNGFNSGSAYLFDALTGTQTDKLLASDGAVFDLFGSSIAIDSGVVAVGAVGDEDNGADSGSAYVFAVTGGTTDVADAAVVSPRLQLAAPNPFRSLTTLSYVLDAPGRVELDIFAVSGRRVRSLVNGELVAGTHHIDWDARDDRGREVSSGVYIYRIKTGERSEQRRVILLR